MAAERKKRPYGKTIVLGTASIGMYILLLTRQDLVSETFVKGGAFAFLPIATAFLFSLIHGSFTGNFWSSLGVEASKKKEVK